MGSNELKPLKPYLLSHIVDYVSESVVTLPILKKKTGTVSISSIDKGAILVGKVSPFDQLIQIIDGAAEVIVGAKSTRLSTGQIMIIPAHSSNTIKAMERFKILTIIIKSGYEAFDL